MGLEQLGNLGWNAYSAGHLRYPSCPVNYYRSLEKMEAAHTGSQ